MKDGHSPKTAQSFGMHSLFAQLFTNVFLALIIFALAMVLLAQIVHHNSDSVQTKSLATQVLTQIEPFLIEANQQSAEGNHLQSRFTLAVVKKTFDIFDESLNAKIGLYNSQGRLIVQTQNSDLPPELRQKPSWFSEIAPALIGMSPRHTIMASDTGYLIWYESRNPPKEPPFMGLLNLFTGTLLLLIIMSAVLWWIAHSITWRINELSQQMAKMGEGDFSVRVSEHGNDEITVLAHGFNQSAQKIERLINANSLLLAHASHEFRTPITRIRLQIEMMDMLANKLDDVDKAKFDKRAVAINRDLTGLNELVESILLVSRLDAGHALQNAEQVDLYELIKNECQHYPQATLFAEPVKMMAQPKLLTHLVRNLLNNAMIHGTPPITVYLYHAMTMEQATLIPSSLTDIASQIDNTKPKRNKDNDNEATVKNSFLKRMNFKKGKNTPKELEPNFAVLAVIDEGAGIPVDKREDIFSPFVRLKQEKKGSGLGLSLVAQIVEAHGGNISTDTWENKTRFLVVLPIKAKNTAPQAQKTE
ncbi:sensor histidine kinase [Moraxella oblonga]|uniref:sensor histidine kinase n=1 Tax=Moraxella oblonga TaxID=200413 RepID=UPI00083410A7|nr:HAMP domain-containing sensor histidine kinase [Moraxella oblonga]